MRDIALTLIILVIIPFIFKRPYIGLLAWAWLGYMNPHRLTWGFAFSAPFVAIIAAITIVSMFFSKEKKSFPVNSLVITWLLFIIWSCFVTYWFALNPSSADFEFDRFTKIQVMIFCTLLLINSKEKLIYLVWVIALSIGFFGIKGGVFAFATGFNYQVKGPAGTFIGGNNELAMALLMVIPLFYFLFTVTKHKYVRWSLLAFMALCFFSVIASYSRGAFLGMVVMSAFLWWGSKHKAMIGGVAVVLFFASIPFIPAKWYDRMNTIETYQQDESAQQRLNTWGMAINIANDRVLGGGFKPFSKKTYLLYAEKPEWVFDAHSIYFEVLASQGYVGIILFLIMLFLVFIYAQKIKWKTRKNKDLKWMANLANMVQVSFIAYMVAGAFLGMAYFDLPYHLMSIVIILNVMYKKHIEEKETNGAAT